LNCFSATQSRGESVRPAEGRKHLPQFGSPAAAQSMHLRKTADVGQNQPKTIDYSVSGPPGIIKECALA
jgi:hypothetical protein